MNPVAIVTGGTSGIGLMTARALKQRGCRVYILSRRDAQIDGMTHIRADVTDEAAARDAVAQIMQKEGRIDILINNAGFGISGAFETTESEAAHRLMEVNLFGMNNMIRAALPHMRAQKSGTIVNLSSVAAIFPIQFQAWYSISKAAVRALSMAVSNEVRPYGVQVCCVLPGDIKTGFTAAREKSDAGDTAYGGRISKSVARMERDEQNGIDPAIAGKFIANIALKKNPAPQYTIGAMYKAFALLYRILPGRLVRFILGKMYG